MQDKAYAGQGVCRTRHMQDKAYVGQGICRTMHMQDKAAASNNASDGSRCGLKREEK